MLFPEQLFQSSIKEDEEPKLLHSVARVDLVAGSQSTSGNRTILQALSETTLVHVETNDACTFTADVTFTLVPSGSGVKIKEQTFRPHGEFTSDCE